MARPSKLTPDLTSNAEAMIRDGLAVDVTCDYLGIGQATWYQWLQRGTAELARQEADPDHHDNPAHREEKGWPDAATEALYAEFAEAIIRARAGAERTYTGALLAAVQGGAVKKRTTTMVKDPRTGVETTTTVEELTEPDWRSAAFWLERRTGRRFARKTTVEMTGADGGAISVEATVEGGDEQRVFNQRMLERLAGVQAAIESGRAVVIDGQVVEVREPAALPSGDGASGGAS